MSSIAAAGLYDGVFREDMFEEAEDLDHPYFRTKHDSEGDRPRANASGRSGSTGPGFVVGHSKTGYIDKIDGPYYFFKLCRRCATLLPPWMPMIGIEGGRINIVPVDFVADALDYLAHKKGLDGKCFHLTDPAPHRIGEVLNIFAKAGHAPQMTMRVNARMFGFIPAPILYGIGSLVAGEAHGARGADRPRHSEGRLPVHQLADALRQPRGDQGAQGLGHRGAARRDLRGEALGLLGAQPRPGSLHRPHALGPRQGQGRRRDRRVVGHRQGDGAQARRGRRQGDPRRARRGKAPRDQAGDRRAAAARRGSTPPTSPTWPRAMRWSRAC